jgi:nitrite reductase/ring-hydroxylating ferredoxin subunit
VDGPNGPILVTKVKGSYYAVDATCPHLGLPMKRGKVADGADGVTLTCSFHNSCWAMKDGSCKKWVTGALGIENEAAAGVMGKLGGQKRSIKSYKVAVNQDGSLTLESNSLMLPAQPPAASVIRTMVPDSPSGSEFETLGEADHGPVGVLLLSVGAPETPDDVEEYLYNVFCDPEIRTLPPAISWAFKRPLAWLIARERAEEARESMRLAGGRSPQLATIQAQAKALGTALADRGVDARPFIAMRYWKPFTEDAVEAMKAEGIQKLVILPLYPQFSLSTSGSALRVLERLLYTDPGFPMKTSVVPAWYNRPLHACTCSPRRPPPSPQVRRARVVQPARLPAGDGQGHRRYACLAAPRCAGDGARAVHGAGPAAQVRRRPWRPIPGAGRAVRAAGE